MRAPVAEPIVAKCTKETVRTFLTTALGEKPTAVITTDGCSDYPETVEDNLGALHHRCRFHFIKNGKKTLRKTVFRSGRSSDTEKLRGAIVWSEFKSVFAAPSYQVGLRRFEAVLDLSSTCRTNSNPTSRRSWRTSTGSPSISITKQSRAQ